MRTRGGDAGRVVHCFAEGHQGRWEAFCTDFDLAVQGASFDEVYSKLNEQICLYVESVMDLPEPDRKRLLNRHAPLGTTLSLAARMLYSVLRRRSERARHDYTMPMGHHVAA